MKVRDIVVVAVFFTIFFGSLSSVSAEGASSKETFVVGEAYGSRYRAKREARLRAREKARLFFNLPDREIHIRESTIKVEYDRGQRRAQVTIRVWIPES